MTDTLHQDAVEGGNYDVVRERLTGLGKKLQAATDALNQQRQATFGSTELTILGNERVRTENNCVPCDIVQVGGSLLFGYNVFLGLKKHTVPDDVFSLQTFTAAEGAHGFVAVHDDKQVAFLQDRSFAREFEELYQYYKDARLIQLRVTETKLLAVFQTGATARDVKVLRWAVDPDGSVTYIDNRGERDHVFPPTHDFGWTQSTRADHVLGRHPHVNVLDTVFVETVGGDLTVKVEDNTEDGEGIYAEPVQDPNQSLDDAEISYARLGALVLLQVLPFRETERRYLVFNANTRTVVRIDAIGQSCVQLPEDHGILFPGGYYLRTGEYKVFDKDLAGLEFVRSIQAPNGEDILYVFHRREDGLYVLYPYNVVRKEVTNPISAHGYSLFADGTLIVFRAGAEPTRVHPVQIWKTPFVSAEVHEAAPTDGSLLSRIGNRDLVRGISDAFTLVRMVANQEPTREMYEELVRTCSRFVDGYYWVSEAEIGNLAGVADEIRRTAELVIDEFVKVQTLQQRAKDVLRDAEAQHQKLLADVRPDFFEEVEPFLSTMTRLRAHRGHLITLRDVRYVDLERVDALEAETVAAFDRTTQATVTFLSGDGALAPLASRLDAILQGASQVGKATELAPLQEQLDEVSEGVQLLAEVVAGLEVEDATQKTAILDGISEVVAHANRTRAVLEQRRSQLRSAEGQAEFAAQFRLLGQSVQSALALCDTPEACDEQLSRLMLQLEELEARFGEFDAFLEQLGDKREEVYDALTSRKQTLLDERQRRVGQLVAAADRILVGVRRRAGTFDSEETLQSWFAADAMVMKLRRIAEQLAELGDTVKADELQSKLKSTRQDALRGLRDKLDLFDGGDDLIRLGKHRFTVNTQPLALTLVPHVSGDGEEGLALHLNGTDFTEPLDDPAFAQTRTYWSQTVVSEDAQTYRGEYLAACMLFDGVAADSPLEAVRAYAAERYDEGYDRGVHDHDAALIFERLQALQRTAGRLRFSASARCLATLYWAFGRPEGSDAWRAEARTLARLRDALGPTPRIAAQSAQLADAIMAFHAAAGFVAPAFAREHAAQAGAYLFEELARDELRFTFRRAAAELREALLRWLEDHGGQMTFEDALQPLGEDWPRRFGVKQAWLQTFQTHTGEDADPSLALEAAALMIAERRLDVHVASVSGQATVEGLLGRHARIQDGHLDIELDRFLERLHRFRSERVPGFRDYRRQRHELLERARRALRVDEFKPQVMSAFVRNKLVNDVYLHLVGDNLAKQMGAAGAGKRTDLMGLLLLISPPGYGKTTLMEYVASRLGLTFVKVNGPALGHDVTSLDPAEAPNATARQEVDKVNLALEMANNVMLYVDDIQHCNPEFLQKFISLCDAQRRIEGVWRERTRTYDLRGKKFAVVMAGNPYTESGDKFQIPDMLANRADTYNLGDILSGRDDIFALSFIENALTSNPALAPLATRSMDDVYLLVRRAQGEAIAASDLSHDYSAVELNEIEAVLQHLFRCRDVLLKVNAEYIRSAAMEEAFRTEPRFQLQGSYRNMNKLAEKVVPAMNAEEVEALITDHYVGEAQTLTTGAEANLLKLAELRGTLTEETQARWDAIRAEFRRQKMVGGAEDDPATRITSVLASMLDAVRALGDVALPAPQVEVTPHIEVTAPTVPVQVDVAPAQIAVPPAEARVQVDLGEVVAELRALRSQWAENGGNGHGHIDVSRELLVRQVLSVVDLLATRMLSAARDRLPEDEHAAFVEDLRREVATAVTNLASES